ncbi:spermine/spermidine synthase domain-containing protein [Roseateles aquatilis]|uniref:spermine/spermidine synthase domain-containing protein n=1 Tax=Roseateles aquatilis TaxID=431061 RepID=UPI0035C22F21
MAVLLFNSRPKTLAMIGLGGGSLAKFCYRYLSDTRIKVVEINPHVISLRDEFRVPPDDGRFKIRHGDGADFVRLPPYPVDVLMVDGFDSGGQPAALCSQRFYDDCLDALQANGLMVVNLHAGHPDYATFLARIRRSFGEDVLVVGDHDCSNTIVFACKGPLLRHFKHASLRAPARFDARAWADLMPTFERVATAWKQHVEAR